MKTGLVLGGGGSRGAYQIGALKAFRELGITFEIGAGTSVGAINIMLTAEEKPELLESIWCNLNFEAVCDHKFKWKNKANEILFKAPWLGGFAITPLKELIYKHITRKNMENKPMKVGVVYSSGCCKYNQIELNANCENEISDYVISSCSAFPFLKKHKLFGKKTYDGWYTDNIPIKLATELGSEKIIAVDVLAGFRKKVKDKNVKVYTIKPSKKLHFFLDFDNAYINELIQLGYDDIMSQKDAILDFLKD